MSQRPLWPVPYGKISQRRIFANLLKDVIRTQDCIGCGTCVAVCPVNALQMGIDYPRLFGICVRCGYCFYSCPVSVDEDFKGFDEMKDRVESLAFGETREEPFGVYKKIYIVKNFTSPEDSAKAIIRYLLEHDLIDAVATMGFGEAAFGYMLQRPRPKISLDPLVIIDPSNIDSDIGIWVISGPSGMALRGAAEELTASFFQESVIPRVAYYAPPSHVRAIWRSRMSKISNRKVGQPVEYIVTVFGRKYYSLSKLKVSLMNFGINIDDVTDYEVDHEGITFITNGTNKKVMYSDIEDAIHPGISKVKDLTGEYSDVSIGLVDGSLIMIVRSDRMAVLVDNMINEGLFEVEEADEGVIDRLRGMY